jgi:Protein of unknown function (DUF3489)
MPSLSDSQRLILTTAAQRAEGALLPLPAALSVHGRARHLMLQGLIKQGLIAVRPAQEGADEQEVALEITAAGRALVGSAGKVPSDDEPLEAAAALAGAGAKAAAPNGPTIRPGTKQALLVDLLRRRNGATVAEIRDATGWQPHTARAALTGLRNKSFAVHSTTRDDGSRAYLLPSPNSDEASA